MTRPAPTSAAYTMTRPQALYVWISGVFVTSLVVANMIGSKLFRFELDLSALGLGVIPVEHTTGMIPFPITFLLTDLVNEYYGRRATRRVTYIAFSMAALAFCFIAAARAVPILEGIPGTATQESFENIFGQASLMYIASIIAFLCGSLLDISLFGVFKRLTNGRFVWLRATGSTVISQIFDSFLVTWVFFQGLPMLLNKQPADFDFVLRTAATGYVLKFFIALALTPLIYLGRWMIREWFGMTPVPAGE
jgi:uncharacterized integral membrane protein (TIGR00697 family)